MENIVYSTTEQFLASNSSPRDAGLYPYNINLVFSGTCFKLENCIFPIPIYYPGIGGLVGQLAALDPQTALFVVPDGFSENQTEYKIIENHDLNPVKDGIKKARGLRKPIEFAYTVYARGPSLILLTDPSSPRQLHASSFLAFRRIQELEQKLSAGKPISL